MDGKAAAAVALIALFAAAASASDVIYLHCPTVFTKSISTIKANYFKMPAEDAGPLPSCFGLNVTIDGRPPLNDPVCESMGLMSFNLSTPVAKTYTITAVSSEDLGGDGTTVTCNVRRSSFNVNVTIPDFNPILLPAVAAAGVLLLRRRR